MKKRLEDRLIELAFDDRSDSMPAEVATNPVAKDRLSEYRLMRTALGQLKDMPEHQLSTERLREALLHQGLKRRYQFPWQALGYGSTACALFVGALFFGKILRTPHGPVRVVGSGAPLVKLEAKDPYLLFLQAGNTAIAPRHGVVAARTSHSHSGELAMLKSPQRNLISDAVITPSSERHRSTPTTLLTTASPDRFDGDGHPIASTPMALHPGPASAPPPNHDALVVIRQSTDADTGLDTAQEVTGNNNVLVGG